MASSFYMVYSDNLFQVKTQMNKTITTPRGTILIRQGQESDAQAYRELRLEALRATSEAFSADYDINEKRP